MRKFGQLFDSRAREREAMFKAETQMIAQHNIDTNGTSAEEAADKAATVLAQHIGYKAAITIG